VPAPVPRQIDAAGGQVQPVTEPSIVTDITERLRPPTAAAPATAQPVAGAFDPSDYIIDPSLLRESGVAGRAGVATLPPKPGGGPEGSALSRFFAGTGAFLEKPGVGEAVQAGLGALGAAATGDDGRAEAAEVEREAAREQLAAVRANYGAAAPRPGLVRQSQYVSPAQDDDGGAGGGVRWTWDGATRQFARQTFA